MRKVFFALLITVILCGLPGCTSSRVAVKTEAERQTQKTEVADSTRKEQTTSRNQISAALSGNEQQTVVIEFDEWEYYTANDTDTAGNYAQNSPGIIRTGDGDTEKPPNAGSLKKHKKGTITINRNKQIQQNTEQTSVTETSIQETGSREATLNEATKENTTNTKQKDSGRGYVWVVIGILCSVILIGVGLYIARKK